MCENSQPARHLSRLRERVRARAWGRLVTAGAEQQDVEQPSPRPSPAGGRGGRSKIVATPHPPRRARADDCGSFVDGLKEDRRLHHWAINASIPDLVFEPCWNPDHGGPVEDVPLVIEQKL